MLENELTLPEEFSPPPPFAPSPPNDPPRQRHSTSLKIHLPVAPFLLRTSNLIICLHNLQIWNHDFFWESMVPNGGGKPSGDLLELIERDFGSFEKFSAKFRSAASTQFGSGWVWLACEWNFFFHLP